MKKHVGSLDVRKNLRVRGRVEENLRVRKEVEASAFYVRGAGEVVTNSFFPIIKAAQSNSNNAAKINSETAVSLPVPATGSYHISVIGEINYSHTITAGASTSTVTAALQENINGIGWTSVDSTLEGDTPNGGGGNDERNFFARAVLFYDFGGPPNGATISYRLNATANGGSLDAAGLSAHRIRARLDRVG